VANPNSPVSAPEEGITVAASASLHRRPCERDPAPRQRRSDSAVRVRARKCRRQLWFSDSAVPAVERKRRERVSETHARTESHLPSIRRAWWSPRLRQILWWVASAIAGRLPVR